MDKLLKYCKDHYQVATLDTVFGLRVIQGQCQRLSEEYEAGRLEMSLSGSDAINSTIMEVKRIAKEAGIYANMAVPHLRERDRDYFNLMSKLTIAPWKLYYLHRIVDLSRRWKVFRKESHVFTESESDLCIGELLGSGSKSTGERCSLTKVCLQRMLGLGQAGRQLQRQIFYTILSQMVGCERYLNEYLVALTKFKNVDELQHELCSNAYFELFDSTSLTMNDADLFAETQFYCPSIGYFQFLKREWLDAMISWQSPIGCFPSATESQNLTHVQPITTAERIKDETVTALNQKYYYAVVNESLKHQEASNNLVNFGKDHSYAEAAAYGTGEHSDQKTPNSVTLYDHNNNGLIQGYLEPVADSKKTNIKTTNHLLQRASVGNSIHYAKDIDLQGTQHGSVIQYPSVVDGKFLKYQYAPVAQDRYYLGLQRKLQSYESQIKGDNGDWLIHDRISDDCRSHLTSYVAAALSMYLRYLVDMGPSEFFQMRLDLFKITKSQSTRSFQNGKTAHNSLPNSDLIKPLSSSKIEHGGINAYHDMIASNDQKPISVNMDHMNGEARKYMGIYQRHWVPPHGKPDDVEHQMQNERGSNPAIIDYVHRSNKIKNLLDWTVAYPTTVDTVDNQLLPKRATTISALKQLPKNSVIVTPTHTEPSEKENQIHDVQIIDMPPDWIQRDLGRRIKLYLLPIDYQHYHMSPNLVNMEKEPQEHDVCLQEDGDRDRQKPKVKPVETVLDRLYRMGFTRRALLIIVVLAVLALIFFITLVVLAARTCCAESDSDRPKCLEPDCYRTTARLIQQINTSVEPCKNFYEFACGGWLRDSHPIPKRYGDVGIAVNAKRDYLEKSRQTVETLPYSDFGTFQWKLKTFYSSCMDVDAINIAGDSFLRRQIELLKGWKPTMNWVKQTWDPSKVLRDLHVEYGVSPFFSVSVRPDDINPYKNIIQISPSGFGLPHWSYYYRSPDDKVVLAYQRLMKDLAQLLGVTYKEASDFSISVFGFEKRIAGSLKSEAEYGPSKERQKITIDELRQIAPRIAWVDLLKSLLPKAYINENTNVYLVSRNYMADLSNIISTTDNEALNSYLIWTLVFHYAPYLSKGFRETVDAYRIVYSGAYESSPRWEFCIEATNRLFGVALTSYYVKNHISEDIMNNADTIFRHVKSAFSKSVNYMDWLGPTADVVSAKIGNFDSKISWTNYVFNDEALNVYYDKLNILKIDFAQNIQNSALFRRIQFELAIANASRLYMEFENVDDLNSYYDDFSHSTFLPVLLQEPYIHIPYPKYMVFGSLGSHFGHELIRRLEESSIGSTSVNISWNNVSLPFDYQFCLANNYSQYIINDIQIDGNKTLASNIADVGGLSQAYQAMIKWEENNGLEPTLPAIPYSAEQLFFISYAQTMCSLERPTFLENSLNLSPAPPNKIRVLGSLTQLPQFSAAFGCAPVSNHCKLW
ncbi:Endothelin-converting enzyme 2 [Chamberlinius hualienensis]